jgi:hypothetical protein
MKIVQNLKNIFVNTCIVFVLLCNFAASNVEQCATIFTSVYFPSGYQLHQQPGREA